MNENHTAVALSPAMQTAASQNINTVTETNTNSVSLFNDSLARAEAKLAVEPPSETARMALKPLDYINDEAAEIVAYAKSAVASGNELTPSEVIMLTARSHEFMFHCQLTSNVANRTSDGLQQLFRQQS